MSSNVYQTRKKNNSVYDGIQIMTYTWYTKYEFNDISEYTFPEGMINISFLCSVFNTRHTCTPNPSSSMTRAGGMTRSLRR